MSKDVQKEAQRVARMEKIKKVKLLKEENMASSLLVERSATVVQKQQRPRKSKDHGNNNGGVNEEPNSKGSRFAILGNEVINVETDEHVTNLGETNMERTITQKKDNGNTRGDSRKYFGGAQPN
jgi:hypothetical protein